MINSSNISVKEILLSFKHWPNIFKLLLKMDKKAVTYIVLLTIGEGLIPLGILLANKYLINSVQLGISEGIRVILISGGILFLLYIFQIIFGQINTYFSQVFQKKLVYSISTMIMEKSTKLSLSDFENNEIYDQLQRIMGDSGFRPYTAFSQALNIVSNLITLISLSLVLTFWKWWLIFPLLLIPLFSSISFFKLSKLEFQINYERAPIRRKLWYYSFLLTRDLNIKEIKLFNLSGYLLNQYRGINNGFYDVDKKLILKKVTLSFIFDMLNQCILIILVAYIIFSAYIKQILIGTMVTYIQALSNTQKSFQHLLQELFSIYENNLYITMLFDFFELDETDVLERITTGKQLNKIISIEFKDVSFKYPKSDTYALTGVNFTILNNDIVAIVGKNGSGKSTIIKLLTRLYTDYEGSILINDQPIETYSLQSLRSQIGVVFQDFIKYELSVKENIGYGDIQRMRDKEAIVKVAQDSNSYSFIKKMPHKLDTQLGKIFTDGYQLSGGQWQKIAITRAIFKNSSAYALDEPSAALDPYSEREIFSKFHELIQNKIGIYISHRFTTVKQATKILVFNEGELIEEGNHDYLMNLKGEYFKIYKLQASAYETNGKEGNQELEFYVKST
ncbi:MAG TPA: ABC transporter ATP-binding protein [Bacillales bacterium]|nr:ABC transporter ATP-binding protein [Bacillales bacterium]